MFSLQIGLNFARFKPPRQFLRRTERLMPKRAPGRVRPLARRRRWIGIFFARRQASLTSWTRDSTWSQRLLPSHSICRRTNGLQLCSRQEIAPWLHSDRRLYRDRRGRLRRLLWPWIGCPRDWRPHTQLSLVHMD